MPPETPAAQPSENKTVPAVDPAPEPKEPKADAKPAKDAPAPKAKEAAPAKEPAKADAPKDKDAPKAPRKLKEDEELDDEEEIVQLSSRALQSRLLRASRKEKQAMLEALGVKDEDELKAKLAKLAKHDADAEERKRKDMSEKERMEADLKKARTEAEQATFRMRVVVEERAVDQVNDRISKIVLKHVDDEYVEDVIPKLAKKVSDYIEEHKKDPSDAKIEKMTQEVVATKPRYAREVKVPLTNGGRVDAPVAAKEDLTAKTFATGKPNSMSRAEAAAEARKLGYSWK